MPSISVSDNKLASLRFCLTYMMLVPSRLQIQLLGEMHNKDVEDSVSGDKAMADALTNAGFHSAEELLKIPKFRAHLLAMCGRTYRDRLTKVKEMLYEIGAYSVEPPHPPDLEGKAIVAAFESLGGA